MTETKEWEDLFAIKVLRKKETRTITHTWGPFSWTHVPWAKLRPLEKVCVVLIIIAIVCIPTGAFLLGIS
jgi:hypothetical protein